jgi:hypothetical protein
MSKTQSERSLERLVKAITPPTTPLHAPGTVGSAGATFPDDLYLFISTYGSGSFQYEGSDLVVVLNPFEPRYQAKRDKYLDLIREYKQEEGNNYIPYDIHPEKPGLFTWGWGEGRKHFFWLTQGEANDWPVIALYDIELFNRFDMPMILFLEQLLTGQMDADFIGIPGKLAARAVEFHPGVVPY